MEDCCQGRNEKKNWNCIESAQPPPSCKWDARHLVGKMTRSSIAHLLVTKHTEMTSGNMQHLSIHCPWQMLILFDTKAGFGNLLLTLCTAGPPEMLTSLKRDLIGTIHYSPLFFKGSKCLIFRGCSFPWQFFVTLLVWLSDPFGCLFRKKGGIIKKLTFFFQADFS